MAACLQQIGQDPPDEFFEEINYAFSGVVLRVGTGLPEEPCYSDFGDGNVGSGAQELTSGQGFWLRVRNDDDASEWIVGIWAPDATLSIQDGATLTLDYNFGFGGFGPNHGHLSINSDGKGLSALISEGADETQLTIPEGWSIERGDTICSFTDSCGSWKGYNLALGQSDETLTDLAYGATTLINGLSVTHGGFEHDTGQGRGCADWFVAHAQLAVLR